MREISRLLLFGSSRGKSGAVGARSSRRPCEKFCSQIRGFLVCSSPARRSALVSRPLCDARSSASACCAPPGCALGFFLWLLCAFRSGCPSPFEHSAVSDSFVERAVWRPAGNVFSSRQTTVDTLSARSSQHTFRSLVRVISSLGAACITSAAQLSAAPRQLQALLGNVALDRLLQPL